MQLLQNTLKLFCLVFFSLFAACSGGKERQQKPPQVAISQDTIAVETVKTLEEKYAGYESKHIPTEYLYEIDATAPVIYSRVDTVIDEEHERIIFWHLDIRESRSTMDSLPKNIQEYMRLNNIVVPGFSTGPMYGVYDDLFLKSQFNENGRNDLAVITVQSDSCWTMLFWDNDTINISKVNGKQIGQCVMPFSATRVMFQVSNERKTYSSFEDWGFFTYLSSSYEYYLWPQSSARPDSFTHDGFAEYSPENDGRYYYYFDNGRLLTWGDAMPGWEKWHERNMLKMQDSLLLDPTLIESIPVKLAQEWKSRAIKIARIGDNP